MLLPSLHVIDLRHNRIMASSRRKIPHLSQQSVTEAENEEMKKKRILHHDHNHPTGNNDFIFEGHHLSCLLCSFHREIESERNSNKLPREKLWFKQHFAVGVNEVTRLLERMPTFNDVTLSTPLVGDSLSLSNQGQGQPPCIFATKLQAVLIASDCNPRWLCKHLLILASCKNVPLIHVKDKKEGSLRLGELVNVKTAIAVGIKAKESGINRFVRRVLHHDKLIGELDA